MIKNKETVEEIMRKQLSMLENKDRVIELEKEFERDKKIINELKEREKLSIRTIILFERKLKIAKNLIESNIAVILSLLSQLKDIVDDSENEETQNIICKAQIIANDLINEINKLTFISAMDKSYLAGDKFDQQDLNDRFDKLKSDYIVKYSAQTRKPGRPKKEDQSIVTNLKLNKKVEKVVDDTAFAQSKIDGIFYGTPDLTKKYISSVPNSEDSAFDFTEALNPDISLSEIMADIMGDDCESSKKVNLLVNDKNIDELESGMIKKPKIKAEENDYVLNNNNKTRAGFGIITSNDIFGKLKK